MEKAEIGELLVQALRRIESLELTVEGVKGELRELKAVKVSSRAVPIETELDDRRYRMLKAQIIEMLTVAKDSYGSPMSYRDVSQRFAKSAQRAGFGSFYEFAQKLQQDGIVAVVQQADAVRMCYLGTWFHALPFEEQERLKLPREQRQAVAHVELELAKITPAEKSDYERFIDRRNAIRDKLMAEGLNEIDALERAIEEASQPQP